MRISKLLYSQNNQYMIYYPRTNVCIGGNHENSSDCIYDRE